MYLMPAVLPAMFHVELHAASQINIKQVPGREEAEDC
jgi:hypothetical protein